MSEKVPKALDKRLTESRRLIRMAMDMSYGCYVEQEATKVDTWKNQTFWQLASHLSHECEEVKRSVGNNTLLLHNGMDCVALSLMILAKALEKEETKNDKI